MIKMVRFASDLCAYHAGAVLDMDDVQEVDLWYQMDELKQIKRQALIVSRDETTMYLTPLLSNTYGKCDARTVNSINSWVLSCDARRGLERFVNKDYGAKRTDARSRNIQIVLTAQHKMQKEGIKDTKYISTVLSRLSEAFSQDSLRFAGVMGQADTLGATVDDSVLERNIAEMMDQQHYGSFDIVMVDLGVSVGPSQEKFLSTKEVVPIHSRFISSEPSIQRFSEMRHFY
jgi:hypothetical protein